MAAITKYHGWGGLNSRHLFAHTSGGWQPKIKLPADLVSLKASLLGLWMTIFSFCPHVAFPLCKHRERMVAGVSFYQDTRLSTHES